MRVHICNGRGFLSVACQRGGQQRVRQPSTIRHIDSNAPLTGSDVSSIIGCATWHEGDEGRIFADLPYALIRHSIIFFQGERIPPLICGIP